MGLEPYPLYPVSPWARRPERMIARPYCRPGRPVAIFITTLAIFFLLYDQTRLREDTHIFYQTYIREGISRYLGDQYYNNTLYQPGNEDVVHRQYNFTSPCHGFPATDGILLVMKTGATEAYDKLPTQLLTTMQCLPDFLLFSDKVSLEEILFFFFLFLFFLSFLSFLPFLVNILREQALLGLVLPIIGLPIPPLDPGSSSRAIKARIARLTHKSYRSNNLDSGTSMTRSRECLRR
jgi:hypothetical protein